MNEFDVNVVLNLLVTQKKIAIIPHRSPDGDAMGATLAMYHFLIKLNHQPVVIAPNEFADFLAWMPGADKVLIFEKDKENVSNILQAAELIFTLDFNALHRTGEMEHTLNKLRAPFIMIDHHEAPDAYAQVTYSDTAYGSTCEMVYNFIEKLGEKKLIDKNISTCLYTGILTDSGGFKFPKTTPTTHKIVAELIELGANNVQIPNLLFNNNSYNSLQLLGKALTNMKVNTSKQTAYIALSQSELEQYHYAKGDTEGIVNYGLSIKNIIFAAIFIENPPDYSGEKIIKISFRSLGNFDVNQFARQYFNGGGHKNAAGGKSYDTLEQTVQKFEKLIEELCIVD